jgi:hypothetical protein
MASSIIYLDESGDLGWTFTAPYRRGGSSRYLTISALCVPPEKKHIPKRIIKDLYTKFKWEVGEEKKWALMGEAERTRFADLMRKMCEANQDIYLITIVVKKENVLAHIRTDGNKLYNYMIKLALLDFMGKFDVVTLIPDPRSIKVKSGNSLHDYLQTELWFTNKASTNLITTPLDSKSCRGLQFSDMLAGLVQSRFEDNNASIFQLASKHIKVIRLFF